MLKAHDLKLPVEVEQTEQSGDALRNDGGIACAGNTGFQSQQKDEVQNDIEDRGN